MKTCYTLCNIQNIIIEQCNFHCSLHTLQQLAMFIYKRQYVTCVTTMISQKQYYENFMSSITGHGLNKVVTRLAVYDIYRQLLILLRVDCHKPLGFLRPDTFFDTQGKLRKLIFYDLYMYRVFFFYPLLLYCMLVTIHN